MLFQKNYEIRQSKITTQLNKLVISRFINRRSMYRIPALWNKSHEMHTSRINLTQSLFSVFHKRA